MHLAITFWHINYLLAKRGRGDNGIVTVVTMALCASISRFWAAGMRPFCPVSVTHDRALVRPIVDASKKQKMYLAYSIGHVILYNQILYDKDGYVPSHARTLSPPTTPCIVAFEQPTTPSWNHSCVLDFTLINPPFHHDNFPSIDRNGVERCCPLTGRGMGGGLDPETTMSYYYNIASLKGARSKIN